MWIYLHMQYWQYWDHSSNTEWPDIKQYDKLILEVIPKTQHRPIATKIKAAVSPTSEKVQPKESRLGRFFQVCWFGITDIVPTPDNYESFVYLIKKASRQNIPRGCRTRYICGLTDETKELYEDYKMKFENKPFNSDTIETGNRRNCRSSAEEVENPDWDNRFYTHQQEGV